MSVIAQLPPFTLALADPEKWVKEFEVFDKISSFMPPRVYLDMLVSEYGQDRLTADRTYSSYLELVGYTKAYQYSVAFRVRTYFTKEDLQAKWRAANNALRRKHVVIGLSRACSIARNLYDARGHCSEILNSDRLCQGDNLLDLLRSLPPPSIALPENPYYYPNPTWDKFKETLHRDPQTKDIEKILVDEQLLLCTKLISHVIDYIATSFLGHELEKITVTKTRKSAKDPEDVKASAAMIEQLLGQKEGKAQMREAATAYKQRTADKRYKCTTCGAGETHDTSFMKCSRCWTKMERFVLYCSKECQKKDWNDGHKEICGKDLSYEAVQANLSTRQQASTIVGPPVGDFKRSKALYNHIKLLEYTYAVGLPKKLRPEIENPSIDIMYRHTRGPADDPNPAHFDGLGFFAGRGVQELFIRKRNEAMTTGDKDTILRLCHFVVWALCTQSSVRKNLDLDIVIDQMKAEWEMDDLKTGLREMQARQWQDPLRRPPLMQNVAHASWVQFAMVSHANLNKNVVI